jgi:pimeloyl-ACP methyl ester carboxylesterase
MTLLVVHGLGRTPAEWLTCARAIDPDAIVPDLPELRVVDRKPDYAPVISDLLFHLGDRSAIWLGHSAGGHVSVQAALEHPSRVQALVLVCSIAPRSQLSRVQCPTLVIDEAFGGHDPHLTKPDELVAHIRAQLPSLTPHA